MTSNSSLSDLITLSFLPLSRRRAAVERLRAGETAQSLRVAFTQRAPEGSSWRGRAVQASERAAALGLTPVSLTDAAYPAALAAIADPPLVLWTRGVTNVLERPAVAMVGSRAASPYALAVAERLARDLAARGITIVSGLARGVDSAAHRGALAAGGTTIAVLGSGADVIYPPEHAALAHDIEGAGLLMSELAPGTPPLPIFFPLRNRIISGLSRAVVVVEAGEKSGSLITARLALDQGRDVLAVPGNVLSGRNRGAHGLLRDGAKIVEDVDDILEELGLPARVRNGTRSSGRGSAIETASEDPILEAVVPGEPVDLDAIAERSGVQPAQLLARLFELELRGLIVRIGGGRFVRS
jgi:DNA processing protein